MTLNGGSQIVELPTGRTFDAGRSRWDGPLDHDELAHCRSSGIEVGYDPAQIGWVVMADDDTETAPRVPDTAVHTAIDDAAAELAERCSGGSADAGDTDVAQAIRAVEVQLLSDLDLHLADRLHWRLTHRVMAMPGTPSRERGTNHAEAGGVVGFRAWAETDVEVHRALLDDEHVWEHLPEAYPTPYTDETSRALIAVSSARAGHDVVALTIDGEPVGQCVLRIEPESAGPITGEVAYWLGRRFWGQGLMSTALPRFVGRCFERHDVDILFAWIRPDNVASRRVAALAGFEPDVFVRESELARATGRAGFERWAFHRQQWSG